MTSSRIFRTFCAAVFLLGVTTNATSVDFIIKVYERIQRPSFSLGMFRFLGNFSWNQKYTFIEHRDGLLVIPAGRVCSLMYWDLGNSWKCQPNDTSKISDHAAKDLPYPALFDNNGKVELKFAKGKELHSAKALMVPTPSVAIRDDTDAYYPHITVTNKFNGVQGAFPLIDAESSPHDHIVAQCMRKLTFRIEGIVTRSVPLVSIFGRTLGKRWQQTGSVILDVDSNNVCKATVQHSKDNIISLTCDPQDSTKMDDLRHAADNRNALGVFPFTVGRKVSQISLARAGGSTLERAVAAIVLGEGIRWAKMKPSSHVRRTMIECGDDCRIEIPDSAAAFAKKDAGKLTAKNVHLSQIVKINPKEENKDAPSKTDTDTPKSPASITSASMTSVSPDTTQIPSLPSSAEVPSLPVSSKVASASSSSGEISSAPVPGSDDKTTDAEDETEERKSDASANGLHGKLRGTKDSKEGTDEDATGKEGTDEDANGKDGTDEDATGKEGTDEDANGTDEDATGKDGTDEDATGKDGTDEDATGKDGDEDATGKDGDDGEDMEESVKAKGTTTTVTSRKSDVAVKKHSSAA